MRIDPPLIGYWMPMHLLMQPRRARRAKGSVAVKDADRFPMAIRAASPPSPLLSLAALVPIAGKRSTFQSCRSSSMGNLESVVKGESWRRRLPTRARSRNSRVSSTRIDHRRIDQREHPSALELAQLARRARERVRIAFRGILESRLTLSPVSLKGRALRFTRCIRTRRNRARD